MALSFDIYFDSGGSAPVHYQQGDNVSLVEITNSDQEYYQNGVITTYDVPSTQTIGDTTMVFINDTLQFDGYINRYQQSIGAGVKVKTYQLVGKTYDLWRYSTDTNAEYSGMTGYIASSLVSDYAAGISGAYDFVASGISLDKNIDLTNMSVGDALVKLIDFDGYRFYVNTDNDLYYYKPSTGEYKFTITEPDITDMTPIEQSDEDLINDCLVKGATDYLTTIDQLSHTSSNLLENGYMVAQKFTATESRLSAIKLYLNRSTGDNQPGTLYFSIYSGTNQPSSTAIEEWSDDISFTPTRIPYPPSFSAWRSYSTPKLSLEKGDTYWFVISSSAVGSTANTINTADADDGWPNWWRWSSNVDINTGVTPNYFRWNDTGAYIVVTNIPISDTTYGWRFRVHGDGGAGTGSDKLRFDYCPYSGGGWRTVRESYSPGGGYSDYIYISSTNRNPTIRIIMDAGAGHCSWEKVTIYEYKRDKYWQYYHDTDAPDDIRFSNDGTNWYSYNSGSSTGVPSGSMTFQLGWSQGEITARASNQTSIDTYGRYFKTINDSNITTEDLALTRAMKEISGSYAAIPKKGEITIDGREDMETYYRFSSNLTNFGIDDIWDIVSYTQRISPEEGFVTVINYGKQPYDFIKLISNLEQAVYGSN